MKLSVKQFDSLLEKNQLILSFTGMSNIGKTYWSKQFTTKLNFKHFDCDSLIKAKLASRLKTHWQSSGLSDVSEWMGQPYDKRFPANQKNIFSLKKKKWKIFLLN